MAHKSSDTAAAAAQQDSPAPKDNHQKRRNKRKSAERRKNDPKRVCLKNLSITEVDDPQQNFIVPSEITKKFTSPEREFVSLDLQGLPAAKGAFTGAGQVQCPEGGGKGGEPAENQRNLVTIKWDGKYESVLPSLGPC